MRAAVSNGAVAVYLRLGNFNARHRATNFTVEELPAIMPAANVDAVVVPSSTLRSRRVLNQLGVTRGTLDQE